MQNLTLFGFRQLKVVVFWLVSSLVLSLVRFESWLWNWDQFQLMNGADVALAFLHGVRFDVVACAWLTLPLLFWSWIPLSGAFDRLWNRVALVLALVFYVPVLWLNLIDIEYVNFVGRRMTAEVLFLIGEAEGKAVGYLMHYRWLFVLAGVATAVQVGATWAWYRWTSPSRLTFRKKDLALAFAVFLVLGVASRGGLQRKPVSFVDARRFDSTALNNLVLNTTFTLLKNLSKEKLEKVKHFESRDELLSHMNGSVKASSLLRPPVKPLNVVILIMESFGLEYTGLVPGNRSWTPFLDEIAKEGLSFELALASGRRSIEGVAAILASVPALMDEPFISSSFSANRFIGLGSLLAEQGYETAFFHGGKNGTMHFDAFTRSAGLKQYFGADEYPDSKDHDGVWGIFDGPFLQWSLRTMSEFPKPFFATLFTISSHQPYLIPEGERALYPEGPLPILKTVSYADASLRKFFEEARKQPWFEDTLFVITADHTFMAPDDSWNHELGRWRIPLVFYKKGMKWPADVDRKSPVQQIDIPASIMDVLGLEYPEQVLLGRSVFVPGERTALLYAEGNYMLIDKDVFLWRALDQESKMFSLQDPKMRAPLESPRKAELETRMKAGIQYFSEGMWENRLYSPVPR